MIYLDTSFVVTLLTAEGETERAREWMRWQSPGRFAISDWVVTEFAAALSMKVRSRLLTAEESRATQAWFNKLSAEAFETWAVNRSDFIAAARLAAESASGLRGGDALHLAVVVRHSATLCTRDKGLDRAGRELRITTLLI